MEKITFTGNIVVLGYGSIARTVLPHIFDHFDIQPACIRVLAKDIADTKLAEELGVTIFDVTLTKESLQKILDEHTSNGDMLVNLTAEVSSTDLIKYCADRTILYLDTCIELWPDEIDPNSRTYDERQDLLKLQAATDSDASTALTSMGANPGIVSLLTKRLMATMGAKLVADYRKPSIQTKWAQLAKQLQAAVIHVNERDTQFTNETVGKNDFFSTWSVEAMIVESIESAEMAIGSHENGLPPHAEYCEQGNNRDIYFTRPGKDVMIKTWLPRTGEQKGMILNHNEPYSIAELYATEDFSPTTCFVYHPSEQTMKSLENLTTENYEDLNGKLMLHDIEDGYDELGVFIMTENNGSFWLGSQLDIATARKINPESSATSLQVAGGVIAGMCWLAQNPNNGIIEPEDIRDYDLILDIAESYWGGYVYAETDWKPTTDGALLFSNFSE